MYTRSRRCATTVATLVSSFGLAAASTPATVELRAGTALAGRGAAPDPAPVVLLGQAALAGAAESLAPGESGAFELRARSTGRASVLHVYVARRSTARALIAGVYTSAGGRPGVLLTGGRLRAPRAGAWSSVPVAPARLLARERYWLAVLGSGGSLGIVIRHGGSCAAVTDPRRRATLSRAWGSSAIAGGCPIAAYASGPRPTLQLDLEPVIESSPVPVAAAAH